MVRRSLAIAASLALLCAACGDERGTEQAQSADEGFVLPWGTDESWYLVGGPHCDSSADDCGGQPRYALDFAPVAPMYGNACRPAALKPYWVTAVAPGVVRVASASLVEVEHENGERSGYYHLLTSSIPIEPGDTVSAGDRLGHPSCEHLRGGASRGAHVHLYVCAAGAGDDGCLGNSRLTLPIDGIRLSGWRISADEGNYEGTLQRGNDIREAINLRCDASAQASPECGDRRNDVSASNE